MIAVGDKVCIINTDGETLCPVVEVVRYQPGAGTVFVEEKTEGGGTILYGLPISSIAPIQKPSARIVKTLRETFGLRVIDKPKPEKRVVVAAQSLPVPTPAEAANFGWRIVGWFWGLVFLSLVVGLTI